MNNSQCEENAYSYRYTTGVGITMHLKKKVSQLVLLCSLVLPQYLVFADLPPIPDGQPQTGPFSWFDLLTNDLEKSKSFYQQLFGWAITIAGNDDTYSVILNNGNSIGGIAEVKEESEPAWLGLMKVADMDNTVASATAIGGEVLEKPQYVASRGVMSILKDNFGAVFVILEQKNVSQQKINETSIGDWIWSDLFTNNTAESLNYYQTITNFHLSKNSSNQSVNPIMVDKNNAFGIVNIPWDKVSPTWLPYIRVDSIDATLEKSDLLGGKLFFRTKNVAILLDPTGAAFGIQQISK